MSSIKFIIFDLDGVLVEAKNMHFDALNEALSEVNPGYKIDWSEHLNKYDGLKTFQKLDLLTKEKGLPAEIHQQVWERKQHLTLGKLSSISIDDNLVSTFVDLYNKGFKLAVCSNSIRRTCLTVLSKLGLIEFLDLIISNEDVKNGKPHPY